MIASASSPGPSRSHRRDFALAPYLTIALLAHAIALLCFIVSLHRMATPVVLTDAQGHPLDVTWVDPMTLPPPAPAVAPKKSARRTELLPPEPTERNPEVVENTQPLVERVPAHARYVSEYNVSTDRETRARQTEAVSPTPGTTILENIPPPTAATPPPETKAARPAVHPGANAAARPATPAGRGTAAQPPSPLAMRAQGQDSSVEPTPNGDVPLPKAGQGVRQTPEAQGGGAGGKLPSIAQLTPSDDAVARATGTPVNDYLPDLDEGDQTLVNSRRWKYASFFNRVKRAVSEHWHPDVDYRERDPDGSVYGLRDRYTVLQVTLRPDGSIQEPIVIVQPCGVDFLDDDAVNAFRLAAPFPNPPPGLVDPNTGVITFKFGFLFEISTGPSLKDIFRTE